ncbi:MAG: tetratricopeptide repeat protein [Litoreibacter sp.]|nr:tetratricopeptide repeat protein [Litoreibacter sp.]
MLEDRYGNSLSTKSSAARDAYTRGVDHILSATYGATQAFEAALADDPEFALAEVGLARSKMYEGDMAAAKAALERGKSRNAKLSDRERAHVAIFDSLLSGDPKGARAQTRAHMIDHPRDALAAQLCVSVFGLIGFSGCAGREADLLAFTTALMPHYGGDWWMLCAQAQSLCEVGRIGESLDMMERSLELNNDNSNASHFKAHALYEAGRADEGLAYLRDWMPRYDRRGIMQGHLCWHVGLWALYAGELDLMWQMVDDGIAPGTSDSPAINLLTDTAALYWRAELAGVEIPPDRWQALSQFASKAFPNSGQSFSDFHAAIAHAMAGNGAELDRLAQTTNGFAGDLVSPVAKTWRAIAAQDWTGALSALTPVMTDHARFGGSRAQRDLLELTAVKLLMRLGRNEEAARMIAMRRPVLASQVAALH